VPISASLPPGQAVFQKYCIACHGRAPGSPGTEELKLKYQGALPAALEDREDLSVTTVQFVVRKGFGVMAPMRKTEISDAQMQALANYLAESKPATTAVSK
jgi:mono/diheme cytochrome c family protein